MKYIVYDGSVAYGIEEAQFKPELFLGKNLFDPATGEMFIVTGEGLTTLSKKEEAPKVEEPEVPVEPETPVEPEEPETPVEPEEPTEPEVEETPSEEEITE